jgi:hypothetical protein
MDRSDLLMIRFILGFLMVFGAVGGMDNGTDAELPLQLLLAVGGLVLMYFGSNRMSEKFR